MHLALNHLMDNKTYAEFMRGCGERGEWITLDNSAHEFQSGDRIEKLLLNAIRIKAREIVIPDVLFHAMFTVQAGRSAIRYLADSELFRACSPTPRLMVVPQGRDVDDWAWCLQRLVEEVVDWGFGGLLSIGLSKDYAKHPGFPGGLPFLIHKYLEPLCIHHNVKTHLLGWPCTWELIGLARQFPCLRSTDSAKPFIYALAGIELTHNHNPIYKSRPEDYFDSHLRGSLDLASRNVAAFKLASRGIRQRDDEEALVTGA